MRIVLTLWGKRGALVALASLFCAGAALAQLAAEDPDWKESDTPAPPTFDIKRLVPFDVSIQSALKWGFDPETMKITGDGIVRYVVVAQSPAGATNAMYEAVRCATNEWKTYARYNKDSGWSSASDPQWLPLRNQPSQHALRLAQQGLCNGRAPAQTVRDVVQNVKYQNPAK
jgi:CNP1-like family